MIEQIKPCPFCGSDEVEQFKKVNRIHDVKLLGYCCWNCGAESGISGIEEEAIRKWNQRPYDYDMPAIVNKVQQLEAENKKFHDLLIRADINLQQWVISFPQAADKEDSAILYLFKEVKELCKQPE